jgi:hypothetical protein
VCALPAGRVDAAIEPICKGFYTMRVLSHDGFARRSTVRMNDHVSSLATCDWCGSPAKPIGSLYYLYRYGTLSDGYGARADIHKGTFCSKACHDAYHG